MKHAQYSKGWEHGVVCEGPRKWCDGVLRSTAVYALDDGVFGGLAVNCGCCGAVGLRSRAVVMSCGQVWLQKPRVLFALPKQGQAKGKLHSRKAMNAFGSSSHLSIIVNASPDMNRLAWTRSELYKATLERVK